jgi:hypothetical protein
VLKRLRKALEAYEALRHWMHYGLVYRSSEVLSSRISVLGYSWIRRCGCRLKKCHLPGDENETLLGTEFLENGCTTGWCTGLQKCCVPRFQCLDTPGSGAAALRSAVSLATRTKLQSLLLTSRGLKCLGLFVVK